jgi:pimeloyl-ACP methyl ester carboxylesterase
VHDYVEQARNGVVVMGHSAGAHTAALLALDRSYVKETGQPFSMVRGMIGLAGPYGFNPMQYRFTRPIFAEVDVIEKAMPVTFACSANTPLLLFHGADDSLVTPENSRALNRRVFECAGSVKYVELDDVGHFSIVLGLSDSFLAEDAILTPIDLFLKSLSQQSGYKRNSPQIG